MSVICSDFQSLLLHGRIGRIADRRNPPAIGRFDQLPGLAAAVVGLPVDIETEIEINSRHRAISVDHNVAVFRVEIRRRRGDQLCEVTIAADTDFLGGCGLSLRLSVCRMCQNVQPQISIGQEQGGERGSIMSEDRGVVLLHFLLDSQPLAHGDRRQSRLGPWMVLASVRWPPGAEGKEHKEQNYRVSAIAR